MRTYSHAVLTWAIARSAAPHDGSAAAWSVSGATLPDLPAVVGVVWLVARRRRLSRGGFNEEVCAKGSFAGPDAALHSALLVGALLMAFWTCASREHKRYRPLLSFLVGWTGHVLADALTHAEDARPLLWPFSARRLRSPISYWDRSRHARSFAMVEHGLSLLVVARAILRQIRTPGPFRHP